MIHRIFLLALLFCVILGWTSWFFRYDIVPPAGIGGYPGSYVLDRWTGRIYLTMPHFRTQTGTAGLAADVESSVPVLTRRVELR